MLCFGNRVQLFSPGSFWRMLPADLSANVVKTESIG